ncbi:Up-regulated during septation-domain-containing protein [Pyronema domesticum]|nr:Up-regulated during septation-domain-containing protein [Pyronema domesticum]
MSSSLYPFPPKRDIPPPVPPKDLDIAQGNRLVGLTTFVYHELPTHKKKQAHKQSLPTLHRIDTVTEGRTKQRGHSSPNPIQRSWSPSPSEASPSPSSPTRPASRLASAREKAKGVLMSRRKGIIESTNLKFEPVCMDSPTLPPVEHMSFKHKKQSSTGGWRSGFFGEPLALKTEVPRYKGPMSAPIQPYAPETSWPAINRPIPSKAAVVLQTPPEFLQRCTSPPPSRIRSPELDVRRRVVTPDMTPDVAPLIIRKESRRHHKRKKSNATRPVGASASPHSTPSAAEITSLQRNAMKEAGEFNILSLQEVELLSHELMQLEGRCEYLRNTKQSLRQGRKTLHTRMISYLRNARPGAFTQDNLLKQEEALADLDTAIEEWETKLEIAEKRRVDIKEKLLEHVAAALRVVKCMPDNVERAIADSPPPTPEKQKRQRHEHENITVYALLADVKQEVERGVMCMI